jgi:hypothetical protein
MESKTEPIFYAACPITKTEEKEIAIFSDLAPGKYAVKAANGEKEIYGQYRRSSSLATCNLMIAARRTRTSSREITQNCVSRSHHRSIGPSRQITDKGNIFTGFPRL